MMPPKTRSRREEFASAVRLQVAGEKGIADHYATNLSEAGLFIQTSMQAEVGAQILLDFVLPDGSTLSRCATEVVRIAADPPGLGLRFVSLDRIAKSAIERFRIDIAECMPPRMAEGSVPTPESIDLGFRPKMLGPTGPVVGIDLGTSNCSVAIYENAGPRVLTTNSGYEALPSVIYLNEKDNEVIIGHAARERMILRPERAAFGTKRFLGRPFVSHEVKSLAHFFPYKLVAGPQGQTAAELDGHIFPLEKVAARFLLILKKIASHHYRQEVQRAVITVPAYFGATQRAAVREAARMAGLHVERILNEPTAAAVAFGFGRGLQRTVLVYDLGGGTFDVSLMRIDNDSMTVLACDGNPFLGGVDFDDRITEYLLGVFQREHGVDLRSSPIAIQRVRFAAEMAKRQLSEASSTRINLPFISEHEGKPLDLDVALDRDTVDSITTDLVSKTLEIVQRVLDEAKFSCERLDDILLVGGQSRSPLVHRMLLERFGKVASKQVHADEAVALGAALIAQAIDKNIPIALSERLPTTVRLGLSNGGTQAVLQRGAPLPAQRSFQVARFPQRSTKITLYRGDAELAQDNHLLGHLLVPASTEEKPATITLRVDAEGILSAHVGGSATELKVLLL